MGEHALFRAADGCPQGWSSSQVAAISERSPAGDDHQGVELRVHGIGDHNTLSALGQPRYTELVESRVWIGEVPPLPKHQLRLVNWSRASRRFTHHIGWYVAFPFTLLNVAGYMEPSANPRVPLIGSWMRLAIGIAGIFLSLSMAGWISVIIETAWRAFTQADDRLTGVALQAVGPAILIVGILYRMVFGRPTLDKGSAIWSSATVATLGVMIAVLHHKPANWTNTFLSRIVNGENSPNTFDAMLCLTVISTVSILIISLIFCVVAAVRQRPGSAALAGAAVLLFVAVTLLHAAGSTLRLTVATMTRFIPTGADKRVPQHVGADSAGAIKYVLLPQPDDLKVVERADALPIDLIPVFCVVALALLALAVTIAWKWNGRKHLDKEVTAVARATRVHSLTLWVPDHLARPLMAATMLTLATWVGLYWLFGKLAAHIGIILTILQVTGVALVAMYAFRRPDRLAKSVGAIVGSIADVAGFWAPDLHPLAGTSYRPALLSALRQAVAKSVFEKPNEPIALVGHSQGSVVCAWFLRGGHWADQNFDGCSDRAMVKRRSGIRPTLGSSDRIALFTCGSPLQLLYAKYFPLFFDDEFFEVTRSMTYNKNSWYNYWRGTDPIGSAMPSNAAIKDRELFEAPGADLRGHGEYWSEKPLRDDVDAFLSSALVGTQCFLRGSPIGSVSEVGEVSVEKTAG